LKEQLQTNYNLKFTTSGDTEVLAAILDTYGLGGLDKVNGIFAFSFSHPKYGSWLVRDRFGEIPIYIAKKDNIFYWASERKAFPRNMYPVPIPPGYAFNLLTGEWFQYYNIDTAPKKQ